MRKVVRTGSFRMTPRRHALKLKEIWAIPSEKAVRYLVIEVDEALENAEQMKV